MAFGKLDDETLQKIREISILKVADELGIGYRKKSKAWHMGLCIAHPDRNPSMGLHAASNSWKCFSCEKGGSAIDMVMIHEHLDFYQACCWLMQKFGITPPQREIRKSLVNELKDKVMSKENSIYLDGGLVDQFRSSDNDFTRALVQCHMLTAEQMRQACHVFRLGTVQEKVIFWYMDQEQQLREGKVMAYQGDGHRSKSVDPVTMSHLLGKAGKLEKEWRTKWCLFGLHQLAEPENKEAIVAVVESEKTAVICSQLVPMQQGVPVCWMACGGLSFLNVNLLRPLKGRKVMVFPDTDLDGYAYTRWLEVCNDAATQFGQPFTVSNLLELHATADQKQRKIDIADFLLEAADELPS